MSNIAKRQTMNIALDLSVNANNNVSIPINLRFVPDEVIVRQYTYASVTDTLTSVCQVYTNLVEDLVLFQFPVTAGLAAAQLPAQLDSHFTLQRKLQTSTYNFQVQVAPSTAARTYSGNGALIGASVAGVLGFMLEFVKLSP